MNLREEQRRRIRTQRSDLGRSEIEAASLLIARHLIQTRTFSSSRHIACYLPSRGEVDTQAIIETAWARNKLIYLPVLSPLGDKKLWFARHEPGQALKENRYGIKEPVFSKRDLMRPVQLDLVLAPLVGFDASGHRLGMGGGYYDRTFAFLKYRKNFCRPWFIGLAYRFQQVPELESHFWDVDLHGVTTDERFYRFD